MSAQGVAADPELDRLVASLGAHGLDGAELALVLGSGLGSIADHVEDARQLSYDQVDAMPRSRVAGHAGRLVVGRLAGVPVVLQQGRVHLYEGWSAREVTRAVRAFCRLGVRGVVLTNAAGGLRPEWPAGTLVRLVDHLNLQGATPLELAERGYGSPYDAEFGSALDRAAKEVSVRLESGVYAALPGPSYETPAEVRNFHQGGADLVGMSTALEALAAHAEGARVAAISLVSNPAAGLHGGTLTHDEVLEAGRAAEHSFSALLEAAIPHLAVVARG